MNKEERFEKWYDRVIEAKTYPGHVKAVAKQAWEEALKNQPTIEELLQEQIPWKNLNNSYRAVTVELYSPNGVHIRTLYRLVRPSSLRPFTADDWKLFVDRWILPVGRPVVFNEENPYPYQRKIVSWCGTGVTSTGLSISYADLLKDYRFAGGGIDEPCGVEE